mgnify:CR=1 FL=1
MRTGQGDRIYPPLARMLLMLLFLAAFLVYLRMELPGVYKDNGMLAMFTLLTLVALGSAVVLVGVLGFSEFAVPLAFAPVATVTAPTDLASRAGSSTLYVAERGGTVRAVDPNKPLPAVEAPEAIVLRREQQLDSSGRPLGTATN